MKTKQPDATMKALQTIIHIGSQPEYNYKNQVAVLVAVAREGLKATKRNAK